MNRIFERHIISRYDVLTPSRILAYFIDEQSYFKVQHEKRPYTFIVMGEQGPTGKSWLCDKLRKHGFNVFELTESTFDLDLIRYQDKDNHVIGDEFGRSIVIVLNNPLRKGE